jgi:hypothetical protein
MFFTTHRHFLQQQSQHGCLDSSFSPVVLTTWFLDLSSPAGSQQQHFIFDFDTTKIDGGDARTKLLHCYKKRTMREENDPFSVLLSGPSV